MNHIVQNKEIGIEVGEHGAEMCRLYDVESGREYLWGGDPKFWKRHAPVLFPVVGALRGGQFNYKDKTYYMGQHGFARDLDHSLINQTNKSLRFRLQDSESTRENYPFRFTLETNYHLEGRKVLIEWKVTNDGEVDLPFSIGAHPAFCCDFSRQRYDLRFDTASDTLTYHRINTDGLYDPGERQIKLNDDRIELSDELLADGALVVENHQAQAVDLICGEDKLLRVAFNAPIFGIWSPPQQKAPFVCIEPWYGRADSVDFQSDFTARPWSQSLKSHQTWCATYSIELV